MKNISWNDKKNRELQAERGVCFEDVVTSLIVTGQLKSASE